MDFAKLFSLDGRVGRKDYIIVAVTLFIITIILSAIGGDPDDYSSPGSLLGTAIGLVFGIPNGFKRLHDTDKSGWWLLVGVIPIIGWLYALYLLFIKPGDVGPNQYGLTNSGTPFPTLHEDSPFAGR